MSKALIEARNGRVVTIINNDAPYNRMSLDFIDELEVVIDQLSKDDSVGAIILRGAGDDHFSVGLHLKQFSLGIQKKGSLDALLDQRLRIIAAIENMSKPVIATLYGFCLGGGLEIPLGCHFRLAAEEGTQIGLPELDLGTVPAWGGTARLTRCVGRDAALDIILRAKKISGPEALRIGLVQEVWPNVELQQRAMNLASELAAMPAIAVEWILKCVVGGETLSLKEAVALERKAVHATMGTPDQMEGMRAFLEKRKPKFH